MIEKKKKTRGGKVLFLSFLFFSFFLVYFLVSKLRALIDFRFLSVSDVHTGERGGGEGG